MFNALAWAMGPTPQAGAQGGPQSMFASFLPLIIIFAIFYFLLIRPQQKRAKQHREMIEALKKGDKVITSGGIYGVVDAVSVREPANARVAGARAGSWNLCPNRCGPWAAYCGQ